MNSMSGLPRIGIVVTAVLLVSLSAVLMTPHSARAEGGADTEAELRLIEQYVSQSDMGGYWVQTLDEDAARTAGISAETVALMKEMLAYQNALMYQVFLTGIRDITQVDVDMDDYPLVKAYLDEARSSGGRTSGGGASGASGASGPQPHPCGTIFFHVPEDDPERERFEGNGHIYFILEGYHLTLPGPSGDAFGRDYTKARSYSGPYGVCPSPLFRNQGQVNRLIRPTTYWIQRGEPNPEIPINPFDWPYPGWPLYVFTWHHKH